MIYDEHILNLQKTLKRVNNENKLLKKYLTNIGEEVLKNKKKVHDFEDVIIEINQKYENLLKVYYSNLKKIN